MNIIIFLTNILGTLNEAIWIFLLTDVFFEVRNYFEKNKSLNIRRILVLVSSILYVIMVVTLNQLENVSKYTFLIAMFFSIVVVVVVWKSDIVLSIAVVGTYGLALLVKDLCSMLLITNIFGEKILIKCATENGIERFLLLLISNIVWFCINFGFYKFVSKKDIKIGEMRYMIIGCILSYVGLLFLGDQIINNFFPKLNFVYVILLAIIGVYAIGTYFILKYKKLVVIMESEKERNELLERNFEIINNNYSSNARLYHDINNHMNILKRLLENNNVDEAKKYLDSISSGSDSYNVTVYTSVEIIDIILSDKGNVARQNNLAYSVETEILPQNINILSKDIVGILTNLLDNAIESAKTYVNINIWMLNAMLYIEVVNDITSKPIKEKGVFITTKKAKDKHGWGIKSVENAIEKYDGFIKYEYDDNKFSVQAILNL